MRRKLVAVVVVLLSLLSSGAQAGIPVPWVPANAGVLWYQPNDPDFPLSLPRQSPGEATGAWWLTRRVAASPLLPRVMHLGSFFNGMYVSVGGGAWATLSPGCILPLNRPRNLPMDDATYNYARRVAIAITGLDACAIEGIAYDPLVPTRMYASAYDVVKLTGTEPVLGDGGVYRSDNLGVSWVKLAGGFRGNGLAVARSGISTTIATGYIQASNGGVGGTPNNGSLSISHNDGQTWQTVQLPASGCADLPVSSQRITPTIVIDSTGRIYAGTNAGLYVSNDGGATFTAAKIACGGVWGIALSLDQKTIFIGDKDGVVSRSPAGALAFTPITDLGDGKIQSLILDPRDGRTLYAAMWSGRDANVFRIPTDGSSGSTKLDDSLLHDVIPLDQRWPAGIPKPFPLLFKDQAGAAAPSLFLCEQVLAANPAPALVYVSTIFRGVFVRGD